MKCGYCDGVGSVDSGVVTPDGRWISVPCGWCSGCGIEMSEQAKDEWWLEFAKLAKALGCLASASKDGNEHVFEKANVVIRHFEQSAALTIRSQRP